MAGVSFIGQFIASRVLEVTVDHVLSDKMNYLGLYGGDAAASLVNSAPGSSPTPVSAYQPANLVFGSNFMTSSAANLSAGINSTGQTGQLDATLFCVFTAGAVPASAGTSYSAGLINLWGDDTANGAGRMSIGLHKTTADVAYVVLRWGLAAATPILTCAVQFDWRTATGPIFVIASRDSAGGMRIELRNNGVSYTASASTIPTAIPSSSTNWRAYIGQLSTYPVTDQKMYAGAAWAAAMTAEQLSTELDVMQVNLASHLAG